MNATTQARNDYRTLRASCSRHTAKRFDEIAGDIAHDLADGEDITPALWVTAAQIVCSGQDCA